MPLSLLLPTVTRAGLWFQGSPLSTSLTGSCAVVTSSTKKLSRMVLKIIHFGFKGLCPPGPLPRVPQDPFCRREWTPRTVGSDSIVFYLVLSCVLIKLVYLAGLICSLAQPNFRLRRAPTSVVRKPCLIACLSVCPCGS